MDGAIDERDLAQLAKSWLGLGMDVVYPAYHDGFETGDFTALPWVHSGNLPWQIVWSTDFEGLSAARSGGGQASAERQAGCDVHCFADTGYAGERALA